MTIEELINQLQKYPPKTKVVVNIPIEDNYAEYSPLVYMSHDGKRLVITDGDGPW